MDQVSTSGSYASLLTSLMGIEARQAQVGAQLSSGEQASDLKGYAASAETVTGMQAANTQISGYLDQTQVIGAKLSVQAQALGQVASAGEAVSQAISNAIGSGNGVTLMPALETYFQNAVAGLNTTYDGQYLFAGGQVNTQPVSATSLADLTAAPSIASLFHNDQLASASQIDPNVSITTGVLADQVGTPLFTALQNIEAYAQGPNGPFTGTLTQAQTTFLTSQLAGLSTLNANLNNVVGQTGLMQSQVDDAQTSLTQQQTMLQGLLGNLTDADLAKASTDLQQLQLSIAASGQVLLALKSSSLLNLLTPTQLA